MAQPDSKANEEAHWKKTTRLMFTHLGDVVLLRLHHPHVRGAAQQDHHSDPRLPARLLHGRARLADRVRGHAVHVREDSRTRSTANSATPKKTRGEDQIMATQTASSGRRLL